MAKKKKQISLLEARIAELGDLLKKKGERIAELESQVAATTAELQHVTRSYLSSRDENVTLNKLFQEKFSEMRTLAKAIHVLTKE